GITRSINPQTPVARTTKFVRLDRNDINAVWIFRVHYHRKTKIGRPSVAYVCPVLGMIIRAIQAPMILEKQTFRTSRMHHNLVYALSELWIFVGHERGADPAVLRRPCASAVVGAI